MTITVYPAATGDIGVRRRELGPGIDEAFDEFRRPVFADVVLSGNTEQLIAVAAAHVPQCPYRITAPTTLARHAGVSDPETTKAIWIAAEIRAGADVRPLHRGPARPRAECTHE